MDDPSDQTPGFVTVLADALVRRPGLVIAGSLLGALAGALLAAFGLGIETSRTALLGEQHAFNRRFGELVDEFADVDAMLVVIDAPDRATAREHAAALAERVEADPAHFAGVFYRVPPEALRGRALLFADMGELEAIRDRFQAAARALPRLLGDGLGPFLGRTAADVQALMLRGDETDAPPPDVAGFAFLGRLAEEVEGALRGEGGYDAPWQDWVPAGERDGHIWTRDGRLLMLVDGRGEGLAAREEAVAALRGVLAAAERARPPGAPRVHAGLTGGPVLEVDEMRTFRSDTRLAALIALAGVTLLSILAFRRLLAPVLVSGSLCAAILWTLGFATLWPGQLNLISITFCALLVGLGVDYGIHLISRFDEERAAGLEDASALRTALARTGRVIGASAFTTALAFLATVFTEIEGIREFAVICGVGVILCLVANLVLLPAAAVFAERAPGGRPRRPALRWSRSRTARVLDALVERRPRLVVVLSLLLAGGALAFAFAERPGPDGSRARLRYDPNLLALQAQDLESVRLAQEVLADEVVAGMFAMIVVEDVASLERVEAQARKLSSVSRTSSLLDVVPERQEEKLTLLAQVRAVLDRVLEEADGHGAAGAPPVARLRALAAGVEVLVGALEEAARAALSSARYDAAGVAIALQERLERVGRAADPEGPGADERARRLAAWEEALQADLRAAFARLSEECQATRVRPEDLPPAVRGRFVGRSGQLLLRVFPRGDVWESDELARFLTEVRSVAADASGVPVQLHESDQLLRRGYQRAGFLALGFVVFFLVVHFRGVALPAAAVVTLAVGFSWALGGLAWLGIDLNPASLIALPLTMGIGIDYAIHVIHRDRERRLSPTVAPRPLLATSTGRAVFFSAVTTIVGFGALAACSSHRGVASIGWTSCLGVLGSFLAAVVFCPALLRWGAGPPPEALMVGLPGPKTGRGGSYRRAEERDGEGSPEAG